MAAVPQAKRKFAIAFALVGFYITSSMWVAMALVLVGAFNYLSIVFETMKQLPPLPSAHPKTAPAPTVAPPRRTLHFKAATQDLEQDSSILFVIQQNSQKPPSQQASTASATNAPNSARRVKI